MADTLLDKVKKKETSTLYTRMDGDKDLLYLTKYQMVDKGNKAIPGIINLTLNDCAVFAANVIAALNGASEQIIVESEDKKFDTHYVEDFQRAGFAGADERLRKQARPQLDPFTDEQNCIRGRCAARVLFRDKDGELIPDIMPMDTRYLVYDVGVDGLELTSYRMTRDKADIESEYPEAKVSGNEGTVRDIWTPEVNEVWVEDKQVKEDTKNTLGYVPVCIQTVPLGSMLLDKDSLSHQGESIFFLIRDLIPELNRLASIIQTLNLAALKGSKQFASKLGTQATLPDKEDLGMGGMVAVDIGGGITLVPIADIKRAAMMLHTMIETRIQRGSLSNLDLGIMGNQPWSAIALIEIGEGRDQIFLPRLGARGLLKQDIAEMFTRQVIDLGHSVDLGTRGHKRTFEIGKLQGEYETTYKYYVKSPKIDVARLSMAGPAERYYDRKTILSDILQAEDPEGVMRKRYFDLAEQVSPVILRTRIIKALIEEGDEDSEYEAQLMSAEMGMSVEQIMAGEVAKEPEAPWKEAIKNKEPLDGLLPLFAKGGGKSSAKKAAEVEQTPREGEE